MDARSELRRNANREKRAIKQRVAARTGAVDPQLWSVVMRALHRMNELYRPGEVTPDALLERVVAEVYDAYPPNARPSNEEIDRAAQFAITMWNNSLPEGQLDTQRYVQRTAPNAVPVPGGIEGWSEPYYNYFGDPRWQALQRLNHVVSDASVSDSPGRTAAGSPEDVAEGWSPPSGPIDYADGLGLGTKSETPSQFSMPPEIEQRFVNAMECPHCHSNLRQGETSLYCEYCGWQPQR